MDNHWVDAINALRMLQVEFDVDLLSDSRHCSIPARWGGLDVFLSVRPYNSATYATVYASNGEITGFTPQDQVLIIIDAYLPGTVSHIVYLRPRGTS